VCWWVLHDATLEQHQKLNNTKAKQDNGGESEECKVFESDGKLQPLQKAIKMVKENNISKEVAAQACGVSRNQVWTREQLYSQRDMAHTYKCDYF
jgi:hypothetical protein